MIKTKYSNEKIVRCSFKFDGNHAAYFPNFPLFPEDVVYNYFFHIVRLPEIARLNNPAKTGEITVRNEKQ